MQWKIAIVWILGAVGAAAQSEPATRAEAIQTERREKLAQIEPETLSKTEARLNKIKDAKLIERFTAGTDGFTIVIGGLPTGQGFALGPQYSRADLAGGNLKFRTSLRAATSRGFLGDLELSAPDLAGGKIFANGLITHLNAPRIDYYGPGPESDPDNRTHFLIEKTRIGGEFGVKPARRLRLGVGAASLFVNTGPGNLAGQRPRTEDVFLAAQVPGLASQTDFRVGSFFADYDTRDNPGGPRRGGRYLARFDYFDDVDLERHDFRQLTLEAQRYLPFFNERRVIALRARTVMSMENGSSTIPFYMQPVLGGSDDLRGFRQYRFYDDNSLVANVEYRWESFTGLDLALFFDAGKVTNKRSQINFHDLEATVGAGMRFNVRNSTFIRLDFGVSHEGFRFWFKFGNPF